MTAPQQDRQNPPQSVMSQLLVPVYGSIDDGVSAGDVPVDVEIGGQALLALSL